MQKEVIHTDSAPAAIGPYVQAVQVGNLIYTSGQAGLVPETGKMVEGGIEAQAKQTMENLGAVLEAAGSNFDYVVKTNIFLRYIKDFAAVNKVYASYFNGPVPARSTVAVSALPLAALVEIEMVALVVKAGSEKAKGSTGGKKVKGKKMKGSSKRRKNKKQKKGSKSKKGKDK